MAQYSVELGWMNIQPCSKIVWVSSDIPGVKVPVLKTAEQRLIAWGVIDSQNMQDEAVQAMKDCALAAVVAVGGIGAITANPSVAVATFKTAFITCFAAKFGDIAINNVSIETRAECMW
ncbi:hypothetical protein [Plesiomonas shigelloides]|uniref:hypothetical protein n=1 Tax=Plesiomonas shigelloides TaxID=703 RepID=UPI0022460155|nr:hypothetical protein [Plesiomonas shigelloides]MCX2499460.1 hypothetical protein [Plesiomonas shigelloides]